MKILPTRNFFDRERAFVKGQMAVVDTAEGNKYIRQGWAIETEETAVVHKPAEKATRKRK